MRTKKTRTTASRRPARVRCEDANSALAGSLLAWFRQHARDLPWRRTRDPYAIWVSEIMLQQTQVKTVIGYWENWMRRLPSVAAVAKASPEKVLKLWEGLGYYTRARNLQKAAQQILRDHAGEFPGHFDAVLALPGIGRYTAGAICSMAFNQPTPILDGNVIRVLTRLFGIRTNPHERPTNTRLWQLADDLVAAAGKIGRADDWNCSHLNQALMELGALICTPTQPKCELCPIQARCVAHRTGQTGTLPALAPRAASTARRFLAFVVEHCGQFLVRQRPAGVINAHLWEFPNIELAPHFHTMAEAARRVLELPLEPESLRRAGVIKHSITRYRITMEVYEVTLNGHSPRTGAVGEWRTRRQMDSLPFASAHGKIRAMLGRA